MAEVCLKRHHSASYDGEEVRQQSKRAKMTMEVGVNGETPPHLSGFRDDDDNGEDEGDLQDQDSATPVLSSAEDVGRPSSADSRGTRRRRVSSGDGSRLQTITGPTSFFGSHQPLPLEHHKSPPHTVARAENKPILLAPSVGGSVMSPTKGSLDSILSQLSDEKLLKDLASAVSKITNKAPLTGHAHIMSGVNISPHRSTPAVSIPSGQKTASVPDYGANTPPPEDVVQGSSHLDFPSQGRLPRVASGPPFPQEMRGDRPAAIPPPPPAPLTKTTPTLVKPTDLGAAAVSVSEEQYRNQTGTSLQPSNPEWNRDEDRFANTPPPDYQPTFNYPQPPASQQTPQHQTQLQVTPHHGSERRQAYPQQNQHPVDPRTFYNNNNYPQQHAQFGGQQQRYPQQQQQQGGWQQHGRAPYDPRHHSQGGEGRSNISRGDSGGHSNFPHGNRGNNFHRGSYGQQRRGREFGQEKQYASGGGGGKYPSDWYRK